MLYIHIYVWLYLKNRWYLKKIYLDFEFYIYIYYILYSQIIRDHQDITNYSETIRNLYVWKVKTVPFILKIPISSLYCWKDDFAEVSKYWGIYLDTYI